jgi:hypothetical protein
MKYRLGMVVYLVCDISDKTQPFVITSRIEHLSGGYSYLISCGSEALQVTEPEITIHKPIDYLMN